MRQAKIFRKIYNNNYTFKLANYIQNISYLELVKQEKRNGFRPVIINSEIMIRIITRAIINKKIVLKKIKFNDNVEEEYRDEIDGMVAQINDNPTINTELMTSLAWASEDNSIDIERLSFSYEIEGEFYQIEVISNGVLSGLEIDYFYDNFIKPVLEGIFNNES